MNKNNLFQIANFIEELDWLLKSKKNIDLSEIATTLKEIDKLQNKVTNSSKNINNDKKELVGILPSLFQDKELFLKNIDIIDFAENLFDIKITRPEKRTRYELIGLIVTEIVKLNKKDFSKVVDSLAIISSDVNKMREFKKSKKDDINFSWNIAISKLNK